MNPLGTKTNIDTPNIRVPMAASYDVREIAGYTSNFTDALDQRKINSIYEPLINSITEKVTLNLTKRPGVTDVGSSYGSTGQVAYLSEIAAGATSNAAANRWVFSTSGNDLRASDTSTTTVIATASGYAPVYVDKTIIQGSDTVLMQARNSSGTQRFFYSTTIGTWDEVTDADFSVLTHQGKMEFLNGRGHILTRNNRIYSSDLDTLADWSATTFITKQITQDIGTGLARLGNLLIGFGTSTMEVFRDVGNATGSPLEAMPDRMQNIGLASTIVTGQRHYYSGYDNRIFWVSSNPVGVHAFDGTKVEKVSTPSIDKILSERQYYYVSRIGFQGQRAIVIGLDLPSATTQRALLFFPDWKDWFEWTSTVFIPQASPRLEDVCLGVGDNQHKLYVISTASDNWQDAGTNYDWTHQFKLPTDGNHVKRMALAGLVGDTARSAQNITIQFSDDDGQTWTTARNIDMTSVKKSIYHCGGFGTRHVRLGYTGSLNVRLTEFFSRVE